MEHFVILLIHAVIAADQWLQRSLGQVIPDWDRLLAQPQAVLAEREIAIGPKRHYISNAFFGMVLGLVFALVAGHWLLPPGGFRQNVVRALGLWLNGSLIGIGILTFARRGGHLYLRPDGVAMRQGFTEVFCPWPLFDVNGDPFPLERRGTILPIAPRAAGLIEVGRVGGLLTRRRRIKTPVLVVQSGHQALLKDCFIVRGKELGALLLFLGRALGPKTLPADDIESSFTDMPSADTVPAVAEAVVIQDKNGSLTIPLTRLQELPRVCCSCFHPKYDFQSFQLPNSAAALGHAATIPIPICGQCWSEYRRRARKCLWVGFGLGLCIPIPGLLLGIALAQGAPNLGTAIAVASAFGMMLGMAIGAGIGQVVGRRTAPALIKSAAADKGTVTLRFRAPAYREMVVAALEQ